jgi:nucleoside-diphosphate-sugar epimerase
MPAQSVCVAVTGATGFIGRRLCDRLVADGHRVRALVRRDQPSRPGIQWIAGALEDRRSLAALVAGAHAVIHCAGAVRGAGPRDFQGPNVTGTRRLLDAIAAAPGPIRLLHVSSLAAREPALSSYAASKHQGEIAVMAAGLAAAVLRPPAVFGPGDRELQPLLDGLYRGRGIIPGHAGRFALIYVDDLVRAMLAWLAQPRADGACYEVHDGKRDGYDWAEVIAAIARVRGGPVAVIRVPRALLGLVAAVAMTAQRLAGRAPMLTPGKVRELFHADWTCSNQAFSARTGWHPEVDLDTGLGLVFSPANSR